MRRSRLQSVLSGFITCLLVQAAHQQSTGICPGGVQSLPIDCDPKHPWPRCPPQTYCYATNSVDVGPYFCCPASGYVPQPSPSPTSPQPMPPMQPLPPMPPMQPMQPMQPTQPANNNLQATYYVTSTQWPMSNPFPSQNMGGWSNGPNQIQPMMARKPPLSEDNRRISNSINQWLEKQQGRMAALK